MKKRELHQRTCGPPWEDGPPTSPGAANARGIRWVPGVNAPALCTNFCSGPAPGEPSPLRPVHVHSYRSLAAKLYSSGITENFNRTLPTMATDLHNDSRPRQPPAPHGPHDSPRHASRTNFTRDLAQAARTGGPVLKKNFALTLVSRARAGTSRQTHKPPCLSSIHAPP